MFTGACDKYLVQLKAVVLAKGRQNHLFKPNYFIPFASQLYENIKHVKSRPSTVYNVKCVYSTNHKHIQN